MGSWQDTCRRQVETREDWGQMEYYDLVRERNHLARFMHYLTEALTAELPGSTDEDKEADAELLAMIDRAWEETRDG